ncbi:MAG TPA: DMT family transporter [Dongiaceae bacterium]|nr:DMT family transporter [Dongiaceae bacterium]
MLVTGSAIAWSTAGYFTRLVPLDAWTLLFWRGVFATFGLLVFLGVTRPRDALRQFRSLGLSGWLFAVLSACGMILYITSLTLTTVAHVAIIYGTVPFLAAGLGLLVLREIPSRTAILASLVALAGVMAMVGSGAAEGDLLGDALAFGMTLVMAGIIVICRHSRTIPILPAACLSALLSALACWPLSTALAPTFEQLGCLALFGLINLALGIVLFTLGSRLLPAIETALIGSLDAPLAPVWVWLAFGETPGINTILGGILVFGAVLANVVLGARSRKAVPDARLGVAESGMD